MNPFYYLCFTFVFIIQSCPCSLVVTWWEWADLLALLCGTFLCVFVIFSYSIGMVLDCIES